MTLTPWQAWWDAPADRRIEAEFRLEVVQMVAAQMRLWAGKFAAVHYVAHQFDIGVSSVWDWHRRIQGVSPADWLPYLLPDRSPSVLHLPRSTILMERGA